jgi:rubrerythrin
MEMRSEEEIRKKLKELEKAIKCEKCGVIGEFDIYGLLRCPKCGNIVGDDIDLGRYEALKWVLGE